MPHRCRAARFLQAVNGLPAPYPFDVAISFRAVDEAIVRALVDRLRPRTGEIFAYYERQPELAGQDLADQFSRVFSEEARVLVVLHREGWGLNGYTGVEAAAIQKRGLKNGWRGIVFARLDKTDLPAWLPYTHAWHDYAQYGLDGLAATIEHLVLEAGGSLVEERLVDYAQRIERQRAWKKDRDQLRRTEMAVAESWRQFAVLVSTLEATVGEIAAAAPSLNITCSEQGVGGAHVMTDRSIARVRWSCSNWVQGHKLTLSICDRTETPDGPDFAWSFDLTQAMEWRWQDEDGRWFSADSLARDILRHLMRHHAGEPDNDPNRATAWVV